MPLLLLEGAARHARPAAPLHPHALGGDAHGRGALMSELRSVGGVLMYLPPEKPHWRLERVRQRLITIALFLSLISVLSLGFAVVSIRADLEKCRSGESP